jgi:hypothetical protein
MEKELKDGLNFLLGAANQIREDFETMLGEWELQFRDLVEKGSNDANEISLVLKKYTEEGLQVLSQFIPTEDKASK